MSIVKYWLSIITNNKIHAFNRVVSKELSLCFNFIQIPNTSTTVFTISVMRNKVKKNSLDPISFSRIMTCVEDSLEDSLQECGGNELMHSEVRNLYFKPVKDKLTGNWYRQLHCHRVFFIPSHATWETIKNVCKKQNIQQIKSNGIVEISVFVNTEDHDCNSKFY